MSNREVFFNAISSLCDKKFNGKIFENYSDIEISIYYEPSKMIINGLQPELPPFVKFEKEKIYAGQSENDLGLIDADMGLQYLKALDPRLFGENGAPEIQEIIDHTFFWEFILEYDFSNIVSDLPKAFINWLTDRKEKIRKAHFFITKNDYKLQLMIQNDIVTGNSINIQFNY